MSKDEVAPEKEVSEETCSFLKRRKTDLTAPLCAHSNETHKNHNSKNVSVLFEKFNTKSNEPGLFDKEGTDDCSALGLIPQGSLCTTSTKAEDGKR